MHVDESKKETSGRRRSMLILIAAIACLPLGTLIFIIMNKLPDMIDSIIFNSGEVNYGDYNGSLLTHRLVMTDAQLINSSRKDTARALGNVNKFLISSATSCSGITTPREFLSCSNHILGNKFYYKASDMTSVAWARHYSDCDLNVYLLYDAARQNGIDLKIVYFPHHALIAFRDNTAGQYRYWETTTNDSHGALADLRDPRYVRTSDPFYNKPLSMSAAETIYPLFIMPDMNETDAISEFSTLSGWVTQTPFYQSYFHLIKNESTPYNIESLLTLLKASPTSMALKILAGRWYNAHGMKNESVKLLSTIPTEQCTFPCIKTLVVADSIYAPDLLVGKLLKRSGIDATRGDVIDVYLLSIFALFICILAIMVATGKNRDQAASNKEEIKQQLN